MNVCNSWIKFIQSQLADENYSRISQLGYRYLELQSEHPKEHNENSLTKFSRFYTNEQLEYSACAGEITPYGLLSGTDCHGLMELYMEQMTHQVRDAVSLFSHLSNPILSAILNEVYVFLKTNVDYRIHYIRIKLRIRG